MIAISNKNRDELLKLLDAIKDLPGKDVKTANRKRKAGILKRILTSSKTFKL